MSNDVANTQADESPGDSPLGVRPIVSTDLSVGDRLFVVYERGRRGTSWATVDKIGRKWAYLDNRHRIDRRTLRIDGGQYSSPGRCYRSEAEHEAEQELRMLFVEFTRRVGYCVKPGVTSDDIREAARLLKLELSC